MIPVLVPRRPDGGRRDAIWEYLRGEVWATSCFQVVEGTDGGDGPFNRSKALNRAALDAGSWDVAIIADSDTFVDPSQLLAALELATRTMRLAVTHTEWRNLTEATTVAMLARSGEVERLYDTVRTGGLAVSGVLAVARPLWDQVGGFDEAFVGYGWEDLAFARACGIVRGIERVPGPAWHLNHDRGWPGMSDSLYVAGWRRYGHYSRATSLQDLRRSLG